MCGGEGWGGRRGSDGTDASVTERESPNAPPQAYTHSQPNTQIKPLHLRTGTHFLRGCSVGPQFGQDLNQETTDEMTGEIHSPRPSRPHAAQGSPWSIVRGVERQGCVSIEAIFYSSGSYTPHGLLSPTGEEWNLFEPHALLTKYSSYTNNKFVHIITGDLTYKYVIGHINKVV